MGINDYSINNGISIYPNPVTNQINIQFDASMTSAKQDVVVDIRNELGQSVKKPLIMNKNEMIIDVADLPGGVYFIQIKNENNTVNKRFIKQ
jgi:hypothetical protein